MCRHSGIISLDKEPVSDVAIQMAEHQIKGGPDHTGFYSDDNITMSHNRLAILDLSVNGNQPMQTDRFVLTFVGEIYNYQELKLKISPRAWMSCNDTEALLFYIDQFGIDRALQDTQGMFSIVLYDKINKKLFLAVDPYGIKPLYYYKGGLFAYASSPGALTHVKNKWSFDEQALIDMMALGGTKESFFSGIKRINGGEIVTYDLLSESLTCSKWYERKEYKCNDHEVIETVKESINISKIADVPGFIFLSGGIDSTVIASQCKYMNAVHLTSDEQRYAEEAANKYNNNLIFVDPDIISAKQCLEDYAYQSGDCSMSAIQPYIVSKEVSKFGKVAISANGSDEIFFGYKRMLEEPNNEQIQKIFRSGLPHSWKIDYQTTRDLELQTYVQYDLNKTLDFASMCFGLEVRVPYLNKTVVEMALSVQRDVHVNGYGNKSILKKFLIEEGFSKDFVNRKKLGFILRKEPADYAHLKVEGLKLLRNEFNFKYHFYNGRDSRYIECSAAAFYCWHQIWKNKL